MNTYTPDDLYRLLPAVYRIRDAEQNGPLRELLHVLAEQAAVVEEDIARLYDNWFIETCAEWVVPYLGDLLGVRLLHPVGAGGVYSLRAFVANTLAYRRRKGTAAVLEQVARDVTGWPARAVEFFQLLETTQHINHVRPHNFRTPDLRDTDALELLGGAFQSAAHTGEVRLIARGRGRYNLPNVGLFLWRLQSYALQGCTPRQSDAAPAGRYQFNPLGADTPLFNRPQAETEITHLAEEINVPGLLRRRPLYDELETRRADIAAGRTPVGAYFGEAPVLQVSVKEQGQVALLPPEEILICNLDGWDSPGWQPPSYGPFTRPGSPDYYARAAVDPVLGRLVCRGKALPDAVSYAYGFSGDVGGGPYDRQGSLPDWVQLINWQVGVSQVEKPVAGEMIFKNLADAVKAWNKQPAGTVGAIAILDSRTYDGSVRVNIPASSRLLIVAAAWPVVEVPDSSGQQRIVGQLAPDGLRPHLIMKGGLQIAGSEGVTKGVTDELLLNVVLNGLLIEDGVRVLPGKLAGLGLAHCTLVPGRSALVVDADAVDPHKDNAGINIAVDRSILCLPSVHAGGAKLRVVDSILDDASRDWTKPPVVKGNPPDAEFESSTVLGDISVCSLQASNSIFAGKVGVERGQVGCLRFCYVTAGPAALLPRRYRCQPDWASSQAVAAAEEDNPELSEAEKKAIRDEVEARLKPAFTDLDYGQPGYGQLSASCPAEIRTGAEDEAEMGVFHHLQQPQREANLRQALDEYLRFGLEAGILYVT
jgi:hypothetical protein